jgi:DNA-binding response OmpR family regulator
VKVARTAAAARETIERDNPSFIFLDVWLGAESGADVMAWIIEHHPHLADRVSFVTGEADGGGSTPKWATFGRPVIRKPFDLNTLAAAVDAAESRAGT